MPPVARKARSRRFAEFEEKIVKGSLVFFFHMWPHGLPDLDYDPENEVPDNDEESGSEESADEFAGTEHYVAVG